jgi:cell division protein FtsL
MRAGLVVLGVFLMGSLFALAAFHAMLASGQAQLDGIERDVSDAQARYEQLRVEVAELESPSRIVREAQERLGMVPPPDVTYLTPSEAVVNEVGQAAAADPSPTDVEAGDRAAWATVKPYLSGRP